MSEELVKALRTVDPAASNASAELTMLDAADLIDAQAVRLAEARAEVSAERAAVARLIHRAESAEALLQQARTGMQEACDLLSERTQGSPARSAAHNARLRLEAHLVAIQPGDSHER